MSVLAFYGAAAFETVEVSAGDVSPPTGAAFSRSATTQLLKNTLEPIRRWVATPGGSEVAQSSGQHSKLSSIDAPVLSLAASAFHVATVDGDPLGWKQQLARLISQFASPATQVDVPIRSESLEAAIAFLEQLPLDTAQPKFAPDGDGGLMLFWQTFARTIVTIDGWTLHLFHEAPGSPPKYVDAVPFSGVNIPAEILEYISEI